MTSEAHWTGDDYLEFEEDIFGEVHGPRRNHYRNLNNFEPGGGCEYGQEDEDGEYGEYDEDGKYGEYDEYDEDGEDGEYDEFKEDEYEYDDAEYLDPNYQAYNTRHTNNDCLVSHSHTLRGSTGGKHSIYANPVRGRLGG